ncbi:phage major capsid protein [Caballeronia sp. LZ032]|uniref:phage major capsid protein n=1 Tax=Caballeronia sp. LZ032 TaxID=3038565 RepID=UPI00285B1C77|nr:phage major capsid protein [Caballeronia sp. LZ032]MDR5881115.1 phage major capsid protein [Caballeronia sp. LZ032]
MDKELEELLGTVTAKLNKVSGEFSAQAEKALKEAKDAGSLSTETKASVDGLAVQFNALKGTADEIKARLGEVEQQAVRNAGPAAREMPKSFGQQVVANEGLDQFKARIAGNERARLSIPVQAALTSPGVADGVVQPQRDTTIDVAPKQRLFIRDLITGGRTTAPAIFWVQETGFTNNAAVVPENTKKPESTIAFATKITPVTTIAHLFKASKQIMDDFAQLASLVDAEMRYGLRYVEEQEILFGDGTGAHLHGIVPQASAFNPAFEVANGTGIDDLRLAMLQAQLARYPATGFVLHFIDWAKVELTKDSTGQYLFANPLRLASPTLWGLPVVPTETAAFQGKFLTGAFQAGAQIFDREDANVVISSENNDDFEKNMLTVRCEERLALAVKRPEAFVYGAFSAAAAG